MSVHNVQTQSVKQLLRYGWQHQQTGVAIHEAMLKKEIRQECAHSLNLLLVMFRQ